MAEAPWTCRRIPILTYYGEQHNPAFTCGNCDVCFAADPGLSHTTDIKQDVERIKGVYERHRRDGYVTRTILRDRFGCSRPHQRVVEYLVFKGVLIEVPYKSKSKSHDILRTRFKMVGSKIFSEIKLRTNEKSNYSFPVPNSPTCLLSALHGSQISGSIVTSQSTPIRRSRSRESANDPLMILHMPTLWNWTSQRMGQRRLS